MTGRFTARSICAVEKTMKTLVEKADRDGEQSKKKSKLLKEKEEMDSGFRQD